jgi:hypothetical protein
LEVLTKSPGTNTKKSEDYEMVKFCGKCGTPLDEGVKFCGRCGWQVGQPLVAAQQPATPEVPADNAPPKKKKNKKPFVITGTAVVALALVVVMVFTNVFGLFGEGGFGSLFGGGKDNGKQGGGVLDDVDLLLDIPKEITEFWDKYDWDNFDPADLIVSLGNATFILDTNATATGEFLADGKTPLSLSVTDSAGLTWTLDVPVDALLYGETITMTAMSDVSLDGEKLGGGVQLSPDGLTFLAPAKLAVTGGDNVYSSFMYQGNHDGGNVTFVEFETTENSAAATLHHFSACYYDEPTGKYVGVDDGGNKQSFNNARDAQKWAGESRSNRNRSLPSLPRSKRKPTSTIHRARCPVRLLEPEYP